MKSKCNRVTSLFLAVVMLAVMVPTTALAETTAPKIIQTGSGIELTEELEYTFESDPEAIGTWTAYDYIEKIPAKYDPNRPGRRVDIVNNGAYLGCNILQGGQAKHYFSGYTAYDFLWTSGYMMWGGNWKVVPAYTIQNVDGRTFMFLEWKSGDYKRNGNKIPAYYVLEKSVKAQNDPNAKENFIVRDGELIQYIGTGQNLHVVVPEGITNIGLNSLGFHDDIVEVTLPDSLVAVSEGAFSGSSFIKTINVGSGTKDIVWSNSQGFLNSWGWSDVVSLQRINISDDNKHMYDIDGVPFITATNELIVYPVGRTARAYRIPDGTKSVRDLAFNRRPWLTEITVPESVQTLGPNSIWVDRIIIEEGAWLGRPLDLRWRDISEDGTYMRYNLPACEAILPNSEIGVYMDPASTRGYVCYGEPGSYAEKFAIENNLTFRSGTPDDYDGALKIEGADGWAVAAINAAADKGIIGFVAQGYYKTTLLHTTLADMTKTFIEAETGKCLMDVLHDSGKGMMPYYRGVDARPIPRDGIVETILMQLGLLCDDIPTEKSCSTYLEVATEVTREQLAETVYKLAVMLNLGDMQKVPTMAPTDISNVTKSRVAAVNFCIGNGLINGGGNSNFMPKGAVTKQETIVVLYRLSELSK